MAPIASYAALEVSDKKNDKNFLVIGPWFHGQHGRDGSNIGPSDGNPILPNIFGARIMKARFSTSISKTTGQ